MEAGQSGPVGGSLAVGRFGVEENPAAFLNHIVIFAILNSVAFNLNMINMQLLKRPGARLRTLLS